MLPPRLFLPLTLVCELLLAPFPAVAQDSAAQLPRVSISDFQATPDGQTINTLSIQKAIDELAAKGGGTVVVPAGVFVTGALFLKPKVNLHLDKGAVLQCSTDMKNFPGQRTWIEGHFEDNFNPALLNAKECDGLRITGEGTLDGAGRPIWDLFWKLRNAAKDPENFRNLGVPRARLAIIEKSQGVVIDGVTFKDSQFWNLHLYRCQNVVVQNARFVVPDDYKQAPSTDGIDIDSSRDVTVKGCTFSVTDDCIAAKGAKGPNAQENKDSGPVEHIRVSDCTMIRGGAVMTLGSEAVAVRDVLIENCRVTGSMPVLRCKLRADTPQIYEDLRVENVTVDNTNGIILKVAPWSQYFDLKGQTPPKSTVRNITISHVKGRTKSLASVAPNPGQTTISDITLRDIDVRVADEKPGIAASVANVKFENVVVNGKPQTPPSSLTVEK